MSMPFSPCPKDGSACSDASVEVLTQIFGSAVHKLATGQDTAGVSAATNVLASMLSVFNSGIMAISGFIVTAVVFGSVMNTTNDGEVMGKAWSTPNTLMRIISGGGVLLVTNSGYSIIQLIVLTIALWGVGFGNLLYKQGVEIGIVSGNLMTTSPKMGIADKTINESYTLADLRTWAEGLTRGYYCTHAANGIYKMASGDTPSVGAESAPDAVIEETGRTTRQYWLADRNKATNLSGGSPVCGVISLYTPKAVQTSSDPTAEGLQQLKFAVYKAKSQAMTAMMPTIHQWVSTWPISIDAQGHDIIQSNRLNEIVQDAENSVLANLSKTLQADAALKKILDAYVDSVTDQGWLYAGGYYQRMGDIRGQFNKMLAEPISSITGPNLGDLPRSEQSKSMIHSVESVPGFVFSRAMQHRTTVTPADLSTIFQHDLDPASFSIDAVKVKAEGIFSSWANGAMRGIFSTMLGTSGDVDAISRIKATGDLFATISAAGWVADKAIYSWISAVRAIAAAGGSVRVFGVGINAEPVARTALEWADHVFLKPLLEVSKWLDILAFYFGVFLPSIPYWIFLIAALGFFLQVLQTMVAAPMWAIMHMTPDRTFIGSQTQGYLLLLSLFIRPPLLVLGLFAAFALANPILTVVTEAFFITRTAINADSYWFVQLMQLKNWMIVFGLLLAPIMYMIFGLAQTLPNAVLDWLNVRTSNLGETNATSEMRSQTEKYGPTPPSLGGSSSNLRPMPSGPDRSMPGRSTRSRSNARPQSLLNDQGVTPLDSSK